MDALFLGKAQSCACRRADGIIRHGLRWAGDFELDVCLLCHKSASPRGQPAWRTERLDRHSLKEILGSQQLFDAGSQVLFRLRQHSGRYLLAANLEEKLHTLFGRRCFR